MDWMTDYKQKTINMDNTDKPGQENLKIMKYRVATLYTTFIHIHPQIKSWTLQAPVL